MKKQIRLAIGKFVLLQLGIIYIFALSFLFISGQKSAHSALIAGLINVIATLVFARKCFSYQGARQARHIVNAFYQGEALKLFLVMIMLALVFSSMTIEPVAFFLTFIVVQFANWLMPQFFK